MNSFIEYSKRTTAIAKARRVSADPDNGRASVYQVGRKLYAVTLSPLPMACALIATAENGRVKYWSRSL